MSFTRNPSVGEPVCRVSDEGEHGREPARSPSLDGSEYTEVGGGKTGVNHHKTPIDPGRFSKAAPPRRGEGCGDTLIGRVFLEKGSNFVQ